MPHTIVIKSEKARRKLLENGKVIIIRVNPRKWNFEYANAYSNSYKKLIARVIIKLIDTAMSKGSLFKKMEKYLSWSGFNSIKEWYNEYKKLNYRKEDINRGYFYEVRVIR